MQLPTKSPWETEAVLSSAPAFEINSAAAVAETAAAANAFFKAMKTPESKIGIGKPMRKDGFSPARTRTYCNGCDWCGACGERFRAVDIEQAPLRLLWESRKGAWEEGDLVLLGRFWNLEGIRTRGCAITGGPGLLPASALGPLSALGAGVTAGIWLVWCLAWS